MRKLMALLALIFATQANAFNYDIEQRHNYKAWEATRVYTVLPDGQVMDSAKDDFWGWAKMDVNRDHVVNMAVYVFLDEDTVLDINLLQSEVLKYADNQVIRFDSGLTLKVVSTDPFTFEIDAQRFGLMTITWREIYNSFSE